MRKKIVCNDKKQNEFEFKIDGLEDLKILANKKDVPYQSLMKVFLAEKVRQEFKASYQ